jgi:hypothetical protein
LQGRLSAVPRQGRQAGAGRDGRAQELYPQDQATGYALRDLRGAISVKIPIETRP